jgi:hypothetical protein
MSTLRSDLVRLALKWQKRYGVAPQITNAIAEFDAACLMRMSPSDYAAFMKNRTAVSRGHDFICHGVRYQVKANRPSGRKGSPVTLVSKARNLNWDVMIWILYDQKYRKQEAWLWTRNQYRRRLHSKKRLSPRLLRLGRKIG